MREGTIRTDRQAHDDSSSGGPLPPRFAGAVRKACGRFGIELEVVGRKAGTASACPEKALRRADLVFAKGRSAIEAMAVGAAVVLCDATGSGPLVTTWNLDRLRLLNFGVRTLRDPIHPVTLAGCITEYDAADAAEVSRRIRAGADRDLLAAELVHLYREIVQEFRDSGPEDLLVESRAVSDYLRFLSVPLEGHVRREMARHLRKLGRWRKARRRLFGWMGAAKGPH